MPEKIYDMIETPMLTIAKYVSYDANDNPVYFDGAEYWVVLEGGRVKQYEGELI